MISNSPRVVGPDGRATATSQPQPHSGGARRVLLIAGGIALLSVVLFVLIWYNGPSGGTAPSGRSYGRVPARIVDLRNAPAKTVTTTSGAAGAMPGLVIGRRGARVEIVVYEDFGSAESRLFEDATRDFLKDAAAKGTAEVEYLPVAHRGAQYSVDALDAYDGALRSSSAISVLKFHDLLYDHQPSGSATPTAARFAAWARTVGAQVGSTAAAGSADGAAFAKAMNSLAVRAGVAGTPTVFVEGKVLTGSSITAEADELENMVSGS